MSVLWDDFILPRVTVHVGGRPRGKLGEQAGTMTSQPWAFGGDGAQGVAQASRQAAHGSQATPSLAQWPQHESMRIC